MSTNQPNADHLSKRDQILASVVTVFVHHGFKGSSMRDICTAAKLSPGALYRYFPSKDDIVEAIIAQDHARWAAHFDVVADSGSFFDALDYLAASTHSEGEVERLPLWLEISTEATRNERIAEALRVHSEHLTGVITKLAAQAAADGELNTRIPPREVAVFVMAAIDGLTMRRAIDPEFDFRRSLRSSLMLLRQALGAKATNTKVTRRTPPP